MVPVRPGFNGSPGWGGLEPYRVCQFKLSTDRQFVAKLHDIVGLYIDPPAHAIVLSVGEKPNLGPRSPWLRQIRCTGETLIPVASANVGGQDDDPRSPDVLLWAVAVTRHRFETSALARACINHDIFPHDPESHTPRVCGIPCRGPPLDLLH
jgi:hypothetical protein